MFPQKNPEQHQVSRVVYRDPKSGKPLVQETSKHTFHDPKKDVLHEVTETKTFPQPAKSSKTLAIIVCVMALCFVLLVVLFAAAIIKMNSKSVKPAESEAE